jgi:hypothetical protein
MTVWGGAGRLALQPTVLVLLDKVIDTSYGQFDLCWGKGVGFDGDSAKTFNGQVNGLVGAASGDGLYVCLSRWGGGSGVRIVLLPDVASLDAGEWEDVVEVSVAIPPDAEPMWCSWAGEDSGPLDLPPGSYRVRVSACGRDAVRGEGEFAEGVCRPVPAGVLACANASRRDHPQHQRRRGLLAPHVGRPAVAAVNWVMPARPEINFRGRLQCAFFLGA